MLGSAARSLSVQALFILLLLLFLAGIVLLVDGQLAAESILSLTIRKMNGFWVWTLGWGLASFIGREGKRFASNASSMFEPGKATAALTRQICTGVSHLAALRWTIPVSGVGFALTLVYGVPLEGLGRWFVMLGVTSVYYVGAFLLFHFISVSRGFSYLSHSMDEVRIRRGANPMQLEDALKYLSFTTTLGVFAIYAGFRGTLTTGFLFEMDVLRPFLITPLILFLPSTLYYNFYPRYVLRRLVQHGVFASMSRLAAAGGTDARDLVLEIRELGLINAQVLPFGDYRNLPSYIISIAFVISLLYHNDPAVKSFLAYLFGLN